MMRKTADFEVTDRIVVEFDATERLRRAVDRFSSWIRNETLSLELHTSTKPKGELVETFEVAGEKLTVAVRRTNGPAAR